MERNNNKIETQARMITQHSTIYIRTYSGNMFSILITLCPPIPLFIDNEVEIEVEDVREKLSPTSS